MRATDRAAAVAAALLMLAASRGAAAPQPLLSDEQVEARVEALLARMRLEEKIGQLNQIAGDAPRVKAGETATVSVDVANTGAVAGEEVVQLYVHQRAGSDSFRRLSLLPGESETVTFPLGPEQLRYWSTSQGRWVQDAEAFDVWVGADSTATLHADFTVVR